MSLGYSPWFAKEESSPILTRINLDAVHVRIVVGRADHIFGVGK
jgi:hypothetical protein